MSKLAKYFTFTVALFCSLIQLQNAQLSSDEKKAILELHNNYRRWVQPPAADMKLMEWDSCLEQVAFDYLQKCPGFNHNPDRTTNAQSLGCVGNDGYVGENLYWYSEYITNVSVPVEAWYSEYKYYNLYSNECSYICGHYTQLVWASTYLVGCAKYDASTNCNGDSGTYFICNYAPGGNYYGTLPYTVGNECTACEENFGFCVQGLCSNTSNASNSVTLTLSSFPIIIFVFVTQYYLYVLSY